MSTLPTAPQPKTSQAQQPGFWKCYSPRGECPISFAGSVLVQVAIVVFVGMVCVTLNEGETSKPPKLDVVEIEGGGGGLSGVAVASDKANAGDTVRREAVEGAKNAKSPPLDAKINKDFQFKELKKDGIALQRQDDVPDSKDGDPFAALDSAKPYIEQLLSSQYVDPSAKAAEKSAGIQGGDKYGSPGNPAGPGFGNKKGPDQGKSPTGGVVTEQRRREGRWKLLAADDGEVHLNKLKALKITLVIPLRGKPGFALRYDLSKPSIRGEEFRFADEYGKVRWVNESQIQMAGLAKVLNLREVPPYAVIYLPSAIEEVMGRLESSYQHRNDREIQQTIWDVRERDGVYDNEPYIVKQIPWTGAK